MLLYRKLLNTTWTYNYINNSGQYSSIDKRELLFLNIWLFIILDFFLALTRSDFESWPIFTMHVHRSLSKTLVKCILLKYAEDEWTIF